VASESGRVTLIERRAGRVLATWAAHGPGVVVSKMVACGDNQLLTVGTDRVATLWSLGRTCTEPEALASTRIDVRGPIVPHNVQAIRFDDATTLVTAASGHKLCVARFGATYARSPLSEPAAAAAARRASASVLAQRRHFVDDRGQRIHRNQLVVDSIAFLPLRRALLLGCEDGSVRTCV